MKRIIIASMFLIIACKEEKKEVVAQTEPQVKENVVEEAKAYSPVNESEEAKKWLGKSIEDYFKADLSHQDKNMQKMTTKDYYEYKTDAMSVDLDVDGSLTEKEFNEKWKAKFDPTKAGIGVGFLISGQDWDHITVKSCELKSSSKDAYTFNVMLADDSFKAKYPSVIKVVKENGSFLIADILQEVPNN
ncbi:hypothetical protein EG347_22195 [Chryseobacterium sp. G0186]|uniref:hypothetical protein n=1 Tax=Chryseobacterium sp. G0186 TaxID=2487064 RepID=UPI000F4FBBB3|nr:hypothetical protein [Chryseobacterium sp. G0186]AZA80005.1 hypothetical protein EG347_22195 [Chryseobacterium sp. G0186]